MPESVRWPAYGGYAAVLEFVIQGATGDEGDGFVLLLCGI